MDNPKLISELVSAVQKSSKFRNVHPGLIARIGEDELKKGRRMKEAVKQTKSKLHQVGSAYQQSRHDYSGWLEILREASDDPAALREACREVMEYNTSTRERLPIIDEFYTEIFSHLPPIKSVLDIACGLNPLAIPWMRFEENTSYTAVDIYTDMVDFINAFFELVTVNGEARLCDVITELPTEEYDLVIMLKAVPCLEQIDKGAGELILDNLNAKHILVTYPIHSLGGKSKGMLENYQQRFFEMVEGKDWQVSKFEFLTELAFLIDKN